MRIQKRFRLPAQLKQQYKRFASLEKQHRLF
jgi:hypothetical protein